MNTDKSHVDRLLLHKDDRLVLPSTTRVLAENWVGFRFLQSVSYIKSENRLSDNRDKRPNIRLSSFFGCLKRNNRNQNRHLSGRGYSAGYCTQYKWSKKHVILECALVGTSAHHHLNVFNTLHTSSKAHCHVAFPLPSPFSQRCHETCQRQAVCYGCLSRQISMSSHMNPIPGRKTHHYLYGNPLFMLFVVWVLRAAMPSSTAAAAAAAADRTRHKQPAANSQQSVVGTSNRSPWMPFWSWGNVLYRLPVMFCAVSLTQV